MGCGSRKSSFCGLYHKVSTFPDEFLLLFAEIECKTLMIGVHQFAYLPVALLVALHEVAGVTLGPEITALEAVEIELKSFEGVESRP